MLKELEENIEIILPTDRSVLFPEGIDKVSDEKIDYSRRSADRLQKTVESRTVG